VQDVGAITPAPPRDDAVITGFPAGMRIFTDALVPENA
jgi:hypothetical protein